MSQNAWRGYIFANEIKTLPDVMGQRDKIQFPMRGFVSLCDKGAMIADKAMKEIKCCCHSLSNKWYQGQYWKWHTSFNTRVKWRRPNGQYSTWRMRCSLQTFNHVSFVCYLCATVTKRTYTTFLDKVAIWLVGINGVVLRNVGQFTKHWTLEITFECCLG